LKELYEAEFTETKHGGAPGKAGGGKVAKEVDSTSFALVKDAAAKTKVSESVIQKEVQIATNISEPVQAIIKDLPVADKKVFGKSSFSEN